MSMSVKPKPKLSHDELDIKRKQAVLDVQRSSDEMPITAVNYSSKPASDINPKLSYFRTIYSSFPNAPVEFRQDFRADIAKVLVDGKKYIPLVCKITVDILRDRTYLQADGQVSHAHYVMLDHCLTSTLNYSDCTDVMRQAFGENGDFVKVMSDKLLEWYPAHSQQTLISQEERFLKSIIGIAHNLAMLPANVSIMRNDGYVKSTAPYLDSRIDLHNLTAVATLADILNEDECDMLNSNEGSIRFLLLMLRKASSQSSRRARGWSASELSRTVGRIARNDGNKKLLVELGCLPLLLSLTESEVKGEQEEAIEALWVLAFDEANKLKMVEEPNLIETINKLRGTAKGKIKNNIEGIFWTLQQTLRNSVKFKHLVSNLMPAEKKEEERKREKTMIKDSSESKGHVMISYQWDHQKVLKEVSSKIRDAKYQVWMDIDNMEGSTLQAMASAIEGAEVVVICISQRYKDSPNCRAEAEYAFQLRRPIIPLIMERSYRPDGWLGFILGAKLFYDFSGKYSFESRIDGLLKAIKQSFDPSSVIDEDIKPSKPLAPLKDEVDYPKISKQSAPQVRSRPPPSPPSKEENDAILKWTNHQVKTWLKKYNLQSNQKLSKLTGKEILFLRNLKHEAPEFFYNFISRELGLQELSLLADFREAIDHLT